MYGILQRTFRKKAGEFLQRYGKDHNQDPDPGIFIVGLILVSQGTPQTLMQNFTVETIEGKYQDLQWDR